MNVKLAKRKLSSFNSSLVSETEFDNSSAMNDDLLLHERFTRINTIQYENDELMDHFMRLQMEDSRLRRELDILMSVTGKLLNYIGNFQTHQSNELYQSMMLLKLLLQERLVSSTAVELSPIENQSQCIADSSSGNVVNNENVQQTIIEETPSVTTSIAKGNGHDQNESIFSFEE